MVFFSEAHLAWRIVVVFIVAAAVILQVLGIYFLIPLLIQVAVCFGVYFYAMYPRDLDLW